MQLIVNMNKLIQYQIGSLNNVLTLNDSLMMHRLKYFQLYYDHSVNKVILCNYL